jgi:hypothetical protein
MIATNVLTHPVTQASNLTGSFIAAGGEISLIITTDGRFLIFGYRQESYFQDENTIIFSDPRPQPNFITIPLLTNEKIKSVVIRPRTIYFLTEFFCFGISDKNSSVCSGKGKCTNADTCSCDTGYGSPSCNTTSCFGTLATDPNICSGRGFCQSPNNCTCNQGYVGTQCELNVCFGKNSSDSEVCSSQGNCTSPDVCKCVPGFQDSKCEQRIVLWDLISTLCTSGCTLNKTFWEDCLLVKGASCYCNYTSEKVKINCTSMDVTHL